MYYRHRQTYPLDTISSEDGILNITIPSGLLLATCKPTNQTALHPNTDPATLFKAEFSQLAGSGRIKLAAGSRTGIIIEIESLNLTVLKTKPFEPKLPLPLTFESELMKTGILQLKPIINQYLRDKPIYLPEDVTPIVAYPEVFLNQTEDGLGYAQILSYCTCSDFQAPGSFSKCDDRSQLCQPPANRRKKRSEDTNETPEEVDTESEFESTNEESLPKIAQILNNSETFHKINDKFNNFLDGFLDLEKNKTKTSTEDPSKIDDEIPYNDETIFLTKTQSSLLDSRELYLTQFESSSNCSLSTPGDNAKSYRLTPKSYCSPILVGSSRAPTSQYYVFKPDGSRLLFGCFDNLCKDCSFDVDIREKESCIPMENFGQSFSISYNENFISERMAGNNGSSAATFYFNNKQDCQLSPDSEDTLRPAAELLASYYELGLEGSGCVEMADGDGFLQIESRQQNSSSLSVSLQCTGDYSLSGTVACTNCAIQLQDIKEGQCRPYGGDSLVKYDRSQITYPEYIRLEKEEEVQIMITLLAVILSATLVSLILVTASIWWCLQTGKGGEKRIKICWIKIQTKCSELAKCLGNKFKLFIEAHLGLRFASWRTEEKRNIFEDVVQNLFLLVNGICAILFAFEWNSPNNPLLLFSTKLSSKIGFGSKILDMSPIDNFTNNLNYYTYLINILNGGVAFLIVIVWCVTKEGSRASWTKIRLFSSTSMLSTILLTIAAVIFTTYFDGLIQLRSDSGYFITDNAKMRKISESVLKVSLNGLSLTVISFTIVFLFHGVGGGLYSGTVLFRILQLSSSGKKENLEILTTLLVILTIIQPFICLHPVIIWSQDSKHNAQYLILTIFVWFLPLLVHLIMKLILSGITSRYILYQNVKNKTTETELKPLKSRPRQRENKVRPRGPDNTPQKVMALVDVMMQVTQLTLFLTTFSVVTHYIINMELDSDKQNLKHFVLPAIISVFMWMMSISYYLLNLTMTANQEKSSQLVFKDNHADKARSELQASLRRRLNLMERRDVPGSVRSRPHRAAPPPPHRPAQSEGGETKTSSLLPPLQSRGKNQAAQSRASKSSGSSLRIKIRENERSGPGRSYTKTDIEDIRTNSSSELDKSVSSAGSINEEDVEYIENNANIGSKMLNFILERQEYSYPETHGWRIKFRRIFLHLGVLGFTFTTYDTLVSTQSFSSKKEIQKILHLTGTNLTWPDEGSALDEVFQLYNETQEKKGYVMIAASFLFWASFFLDLLSYWSQRREVKSLAVSGSRVVNFLGSLFVFASVILVGLPDYLEASNLDKICPYCGEDFNKTVKQVAEFSIGLFFACLFTFQLLPVLLTIAPALVRASCLILIHPGNISPVDTFFI